MIAYREALACLLRDVARLPAEQVPAARAAGRILAAPLRAAIDLPRFDNAALDGYALRVAGPALPAGTQRRVAGQGVAGAPPPAPGADEAAAIMTGAPMPAGCDAVAPLEQVRRLDAGERIRLLDTVEPGQHVRRRGEDVAAGEAVMAAGDLLRGGHVALLAALGMAQVEVVRRPRVAVIATGGELAAPQAALGDAQIHDSNTPLAVARIAAAGGDVVHCAAVGDAPEAFARALDDACAAGADLVLSTGAVSRGSEDFVPAAMRAVGAEVRFHGVRIRPGKPVLHARLRDGTPFLGLPGNPLAVAVGLRFFAEPVLRAMLGLPGERFARLPLVDAHGKRAGLTTFLTARIECGADGRLAVQALPQQGSFRLRPLLEQQAWAILPGDADGVAAGEPVEVAAPGHLEALAWRPVEVP